MRIGVMLRHFGELGGIGVYTANVLNNLFRIDVKNQYILIFRTPDQVEQFQRFPNVTEKVIKASYKVWWDQISVPRFANKERLDLIYSPKMSIPLLTHCKTISCIHGGEQFVVPWAFKWFDRAYFTFANWLYCKRASAVITMTHQGKKDISVHMGADLAKIHVIYEAYNEHCKVLKKSETEHIRKKYDLPEQFILFVGGINPLKNFGNLLRAYNKVRNIFPNKLVVVGFTRWKFSKDLELVNQLGLRNYVLFKGFVSDEEIPAFYNLADLFVFPSLYEGFGIPVLEAMACGCPVVTTKTGCTPEVAGGAALLVDPYNPDDIAEAIKKVLTEESLRKNLIEKGLKRAKQFSWEKCAKETLELFESLNNESFRK